ncbi:MAG: HAD family hydrolase [Nitrososphaeraceae archaeon]
MNNQITTIFFDIGQTLIDEWKFMEVFDIKFLEILNGYGARIDFRNYVTLRNNIIKNRKIGNESIERLILQVCRLTLPKNYENLILEKIKPELKIKKDCRLHKGVKETLEILSQDYDLGIISNQEKESIKILFEEKIHKYFKAIFFASEIKSKKPDKNVFLAAMHKIDVKEAKNCIMIGDRLDNDICPANRLGMKTIRFNNSLFRLQEPQEICEISTYEINHIKEIIDIL